MSDNDAPAAAAPAPADADAGQGSPLRVKENRPGIKLIIPGAILLFLAPLAGFLGGTMVGSPGAIGGLDPLFLWLFIGMVVGGIGGAVALLGALRWVRANRGAD
ncbi:hypothetical protein [Paenarthrobacter sp. PH39-S1]|uniref:hypothetical protein n=1 Tax=Paenarthrobacter sp. PH39-S1 TaxID=3046204 RepID=UPI0024BB1620|nr:hypothetical protein [Paenarthrobacter sp. PH39-S1]MDJ0358233.1 hypothetical protein [Paenarthrobacter sp. PH39-S1]